MAAELKFADRRLSRDDEEAGAAVHDTGRCAGEVHVQRGARGRCRLNEELVRAVDGRGLAHVVEHDRVEGLARGQLREGRVRGVQGIAVAQVAQRVLAQAHVVALVHVLELVLVTEADQHRAPVQLRGRLRGKGGERGAHLAQAVADATQTVRARDRELRDARRHLGRARAVGRDEDEHADRLGDDDLARARARRAAVVVVGGVAGLRGRQLVTAVDIADDLDRRRADAADVGRDADPVRLQVGQVRAGRRDVDRLRLDDHRPGAAAAGQPAGEVEARDELRAVVLQQARPHVQRYALVAVEPRLHHALPPR
eukprot:Unigene16536_Nuclearia_a/m.48924 Unigene16536_Nuclearia_a/g.48924  ORF Unigene16536_Nuclearia_a/g.48924 Unigene16536_Nuclearia_a/m.48924 type:complete len:312 (+) Unigene16536_Nuclearia_a:69-1004(+)